MTSPTVMIHALHSVALTVLHDEFHLEACLFCVQASAEIEEDCTSSRGSVSDAADQLTSEQQLHEEHHHQQQRLNRQDCAPAPRHAAADICDGQASSSHQSPNEHLQQMHQPTQQTRPDEQTAAAQSHNAASLPANGPRQVLGSSSHNTQLKDLQQQDDGLALVDDASYMIDILIQRQGLNPQLMDVNVKLGLIMQAVGLLVTHRHQQEDHRCSPCQTLHVNKQALHSISCAC